MLVEPSWVDACMLKGNNCCRIAIKKLIHIRYEKGAENIVICQSRSGNTSIYVVSHVTGCEAPEPISR